MILTALLIAAAPAVAQACKDNRGVDRCERAAQARMRALYGLRSIEEHASAGDEVRRVFYVDGYGTDTIAITFVRAPGRDPQVSVHFPKRDGKRASPPLRTLVSHPVWQELVRRSALFDRARDRMALPDGIIAMCLHAWVYIVEVNEPARYNNEHARLRRKTEDGCGNGLVEAFADEVQRAALPLFPYCDRLDPAQHRNAADQLFACGQLSGDRMAAAEAINMIRRANLAEPTTGDRLVRLFADKVAIEWGSEPRTLSSSAASEHWASKLAEALKLAEPGQPYFYFEYVEGIAADRVKVTGELILRYVPGPNDEVGHYLTAPVELILIAGPSRQWVISAAKVGPGQTQNGK